MRIRGFILAAAAACVLPGAAFGALYSENFDADATANWTVNDNNLGTNAANFYFDYSTVGIPSAPNSGGTTRGLKIGANLDSATSPGSSSQIPGISVSPTGQSFAGDYVLRFDWWSNYIGPLNVGAAGSTNLSNYGIMSSGTSANYPGAIDGVVFSATGDGQSSADYRIYSPERQTSYDIFATSANPLDAHVIYAAGSRNQSAGLYGTTFPAGATAPGMQASLGTQTSSTIAGAAGFRWHDVEIAKSGATVTWTVDGTLLGTIDTSSFTTGGSNIVFGHSDTNNTTNSNAALLDQLQFTLIDNVSVDVLPEPTGVLPCVLGALGLAARRRRRQV